MLTFREFLMRELEAAPAIGGGASAPSSGSPKTINDFGFAKRELGGFYGLKPKDYLKEPITSFEPLDMPGQPRTSAPVFIDMEDSDEEGDLQGKVMYSVARQDKMRNPNGTQFTGKPQDKPIRLRNRKHNKSRTLDDLLLGPFAAGGAGAGGAPPMGAPPMGGGL